MVLLVGTAVTLIMLIAAGTFDPQPVGELQWEWSLSPQTIDAVSPQITWLEPATPGDNYSVRLTTIHQSGETDVLYGLVIGDDESYLVTAVSPLGYAAVWEQHSAFSIHHSAFQPWPHVRPDENEIWLDVVDGRVTVRINRELLWSGSAAANQGRIGLWTESFGGTAVFDFRQLQLFAKAEQ